MACFTMIGIWLELRICRLVLPNMPTSVLPSRK